MIKWKNTIVLFVMAMTCSCFAAFGQSEVDRLRQASAVLQGQRQSGQQQLNRDIEELNRRIQAYNNALAAKRPRDELDRLKKDCDAAQQKATITQRSLDETTKNLQQVVQRLQEAQRLENQRKNEEAKRAKLKYEEDVRREKQAQAERKRQEQQKSKAGSASPGADNAAGKFIKRQNGIVGQFQGNAHTPGLLEAGVYASVGGQVGQEGWLEYPIYINVGRLTDANKWNVGVAVLISGNWREDSGLMVDFVYPQDSSPQNAKQTVHAPIIGNNSRATNLFADIISEGRQVVHVGSVRVRARDGQMLATAFKITITSILASPAK